MIRGFLLLFFSICVMVGHAQSSADWWYFGNLAGMHFESGGPVSVGDGQLITNEGCASISNPQGDLLFYTDGLAAWNANHVNMLNGTGLLGSPSASQSAIIVPHPTTDQYYFLITVPDWGSPDSGLRYSLVDMNLDGGLGGVVASEKNVLIANDVIENVCVVPHSNASKFWLVAHKAESDSLYAFEISSSGISTVPVVSHIPPVIPAKVGCIKGSVSGDLIAYASYFGPSDVKVMQFDNGTGQASNSVYMVPQFVPSCYGTEFSPDGSRLYVSSFGSGGVSQFDVSVYDSATIVNSEVELYNGVSGQLQLGPDSKIYHARNSSSYLSAINDPNELGLACNYTDSAVFLSSGSNYQGLPPFVSSFLRASITFSKQCFGDVTQFLTDTTGLDSLFWNFGEPSSGANNVSILPFPNHEYGDTGVYTVTLIAFADTLIDTAISLVRIYPRQAIDLGEDQFLCGVDTVIFSATQPFASFLWQDSTTNDSMWVGADTTVWVTVFGVCDTVSDTVNVVYADSIQFDLGPDTLLCDGVGYILDANIDTAGVTFEWNTGDSTESITATVSDQYILTATNACGTVIDSVNVTFKPVPLDSFLPPDTLNCFDNPIVLVRPDQDSTTYIWSDSTSKKNYTVDTTETVWLAAFNECGFSVDTIDIIFNGEIFSELGEDTNICEGDSILLIATHPGASYVWNTGDTTDTAWTDQVESFNYVVTVTYKACQTIESKRVDMDDFFCEPIDCVLEYPNTFSPNGDGINDIFRPRSDCEIYSYTLTVYNRWGLLVHHDTHEAFGWDGNVNGQPAPEGVYYFLIDFLDQVVVDEDRNIYQGSMTIVR